MCQKEKYTIDHLRADSLEFPLYMDLVHRAYLHHCIDAEYNRPKVLGSNPDLDGLDDGKGEGHTPEYPTNGTRKIIGNKQHY